MQSSEVDDDFGDDDERYPLDVAELAELSQVAKLVRARLHKLQPIQIRAAASILLALERLPRITPGVCAVFSFRIQESEGNHSWADIQIGDDGLLLGIGRHFYDSDVGGDTLCHTSFLANEYKCEGSIANWLSDAEEMIRKGIPDSRDESDYESIDWWD